MVCRSPEDLDVAIGLRIPRRVLAVSLRRGSLGATLAARWSTAISRRACSTGFFSNQLVEHLYMSRPVRGTIVTCAPSPTQAITADDPLATGNQWLEEAIASNYVQHMLISTETKVISLLWKPNIQGLQIRCGIDLYQEAGLGHAWHPPFAI